MRKLKHLKEMMWHYNPHIQLIKKHAIIVLLVLPFFSYAQYTEADNYKKWTNINSVYQLALNKNGLSESAYQLEARVRVERWTNSSQFILDINAVQSTPSNPSPSYKHSYNYLGKQYGNQHVGYDPFIPIKAGNLRYEVILTYGSKSWTKIVDGMTGIFGPVEKDAKASGVALYIKVVEVNDWNGNRQIEDILNAQLNAEREKKLAEQKKIEDDKKAAADKLAVEKKAADDKKIAADKEMAEEKKVASEKKTADDKKIAEGKNAANSKTSAAAGTNDKEGTTASGSADSKTAKGSGGKTKEVLQEEQEAARQAAIDRKNAEREAEIARQKAEEERLQQKQTAYDNWKAGKDKEQAQVEAASMAASFGVLTMVGGWIYNDKMGNVNPDFIYKANRKKPRFHLGIDWGYSASSFPVIFNSEISTMRGGREVVEKSLEKKLPFVINLEANVKMGIDHDMYGGYGYLNPKFGFSPIFDAFQFSPLLYGARVYGGLKWVKAYVEYGGGSRTWTQTSNDVEEIGSAKSDMTFTKIGYGLRFTTNADADYRRSHISIGLIDERLSAGGIGYFTDPVTNNIIKTGKSSVLKGYAFEWKKDHNFSLYCNLYPEYSYSGEIEYKAGAPSSDFKASPGGGMFIEFGFLRSVDWW